MNRAEVEHSEGSELAEKSIWGRDELNLAEFPLAAINDRLSEDCKTLVFEDQIRDQGTGEYLTRRLTITASELYGLPTALDDDVIVGLMQITKATNNFTDRTVPFSRAELIKLLGWTDCGKSYARLEQSLKRWLTVTLHYQKAWWDKDAQAWVDSHFHILDNLELYDRQARPARRGTGQPNESPRSSFSWNRVVFKSFQAENLKKLNLGLYFRLSRAPAKRAYRFLDKRFYRSSRVELDLRDFACEHVGLSRKYDTGKLKEKLQPSIEELEEVGFIEPRSRATRYAQVRRGSWQVVFEKKASRAVQPRDLEKATLGITEESPLLKKLLDRKVTPSAAKRLIEIYPAAQIECKIEVFDWVIKNKDSYALRNPAGYLVRSIEEDYLAPAKFEIKTQGLSRPELKTGMVDERARRGEEKLLAQRAQIQAHWNSLSAEQQQELEELAFREAEPWLRKQVERHRDTDSQFAREFLKVILEKYIRRHCLERPHA